MNLKKIAPILLVVFLTSTVMPAFASEIPLSKKEIPKDVRAQQIEMRLIEIRDLAKTNLTSTEKRGLRKEVKGLKKESNHGIYLSVGAIIIIILLLILLL